MDKSPQRWIEIVNWDRFQHYGDRDPIWVKNYTALLDNPDYLALTWPQRGLLHGLWMMNARTKRSIPLDLKMINTYLAGSAKMSMLEALNHAGFIRFRASKPLSRRYPRTRNRKNLSSREKTNPNNDVPRDPNALGKIRELADRIGKKP